MTERRTFSLRHTVGTVGSILLVSACIVMGGGAGFINIPALMITVGLPLLLLFGIYGRTMGGFIIDALLMMFTEPPVREIDSTYRQIAQHFARYVIGSGVIGTLIGLIQMLRSLDDPCAVGAGLACALLTVFYALVISELTMAFLVQAYGKAERNPKSMSLRSCGIAVAVVFLALFAFFYIITAFVSVDNEEPTSALIHIDIPLTDQPQPVHLSFWIDTDDSQALKLLLDQTDAFDEVASAFIASLPLDKRRSSYIAKQFEIDLMDTANALLKEHGQTGRVIDANYWGYEMPAGDSTSIE